MTEITDATLLRMARAAYDTDQRGDFRTWAPIADVDWLDVVEKGDHLPYLEMVQAAVEVMQQEPPS